MTKSSWIWSGLARNYQKLRSANHPGGGLCAQGASLSDALLLILLNFYLDDLDDLDGFSRSQ